MFIVSKNTQALYLTAVAKDRLPVFQSDAIKQVTCAALDEARTSCGCLLFAYVIMPDHVHLMTDSPRTPSEVLRFINTGNASRDVQIKTAQNNFIRSGDVGLKIVFLPFLGEHGVNLLGFRQDGGMKRKTGERGCEDKEACFHIFDEGSRYFWP